MAKSQILRGLCFNICFIPSILVKKSLKDGYYLGMFLRTFSIYSVRIVEYFYKLYCLFILIKMGNCVANRPKIISDLEKP